MGQKLSIKNLLLNKGISIGLGLNPKEFNCFKDFMHVYFPEEKDLFDFEEFKDIGKIADTLQNDVTEHHLFNKPIPDYNYEKEEEKLNKEEVEELEKPLKIWLPKLFNDLFIPLPEFKALPIDKRIYIYIMFKLSLEDGDSAFETFFDKDIFHTYVQVLEECKDIIPYTYTTIEHYVKSEKKTIYVVAFTIKTPDNRKFIENTKERAQLRQIIDYGNIYERIIKHKPVEVFSNPVLAHIIPKMKGKITSPWYSCGMIFKVTV